MKIVEQVQKVEAECGFVVEAEDGFAMEEEGVLFWYSNVADPVKIVGDAAGTKLLSSSAVSGNFSKSFLMRTLQVWQFDFEGGG